MPNPRIHKPTVSNAINNIEGATYDLRMARAQHNAKDMIRALERIRSKADEMQRHLANELAKADPDQMEFL